MMFNINFNYNNVINRFSCTPGKKISVYLKFWSELEILVKLRLSDPTFLCGCIEHLITSLLSTHVTMTSKSSISKWCMTQV